jgi:uncharacterized protein YecT (DUF1311 family)
MSNAYEKADAELNRIYKLAFKGLDEKEAENLKKAQRAWSSIAMRNVMLNMPNGVEAAGSRSPPRMPRPVNSTPDQRTAQDVSVSINVTGHIVPPRTSPWSNEKPA